MSRAFRLVSRAAVLGTAALVTALAVAALTAPRVHSATGPATAPRAAASTTPAANAEPTPPALTVRAATLVVQGTGQRLYGLDPGAELPIASTTKLMTALETLEHAPTQAMFSYPAYYLSSQDSQIDLTPGEQMSVHDLLVAMMLPSADDAAYDLAFNIGHGSVPRFIAMMNADARRLHLTETHYATPIGLDTPGNYSSAFDLVQLASYLLEHYPLFAGIVAMPSAVLHTGSHVRTVVNLNDLVSRVHWIHGVKTGHTLDAGYVLVASGTRNGMTLESAVLGTSSQAARDQNTLSLLDWGFANFRQAKPVTAGAVLARPTVADRPGVHAEVIAERSFSEAVRRAVHLHLKLRVPAQLSGPLARHAMVGSATVLADGRSLGSVPLVLAQALPAVSPLTVAVRFVTRTSTLVALVVLLGGVGTLVVRRRGQRRTRQPETA